MNGEWPIRHGEDLAALLLPKYSVTDADELRHQYIAQVEQYPLYERWFNLVVADIESMDGAQRCLEIGPGPGILAERLVGHPGVCEYVAAEPDVIFQHMVNESTGGRARIVPTPAEELEEAGFDVVIATATYHHLDDKVKALAKIMGCLRPGGRLLIGDVFLPHYEFDAAFKPRDPAVFVRCVLESAAAQILSMSAPEIPDVVDQITTAILDIMQIEEMKVCVGVLEEQLRQVGYDIHTCNLLHTGKNDARAASRGWYYVVASRAT